MTDDVTTDDMVRRRKLWPVAEAAYQLGVHRVTLYRLEAAGDIRFTRVGGRTYVTDAELDRFVARAEVRSERRSTAS
jgi:excisionase family DNA binding protein